jgi:hypothetical protein
MATQEIVVDQRPSPQAPIDTSVVIPEHVRRAAEHAESFYKQQEQPAEPVAEVAPAPAEPVAEAAPAPTEPQPAPQEHVHQQPDFIAPASKDEMRDSEWAARYNSMRGRWETAQRTIGSMQEQLSQLGDELMRTQALLRNQQPEPPREQAQPQRLITPEDEQAYGPELIDLARRAAAETLGPEIDALRAENSTLKQRVTTTAKGELRQQLSAAVPNWQVINKSPEFKSWLRLRNIYTGEIRQSMLNAAYEAADAPKVVAFFKDFLREGIATGQMAPAPQIEQPLAPRTPAVSLEVLAAPGRARPASGESPASPADKPIYTRAQIKTFYDQVRAGYYAGRETDKARLEQSIFSAQAEGRVR